MRIWPCSLGTSTPRFAGSPHALRRPQTFAYAKKLPGHLPCCSNQPRHYYRKMMMAHAGASEPTSPFPGNLSAAGRGRLVGGGHVGLCAAVPAPHPSPRTLIA